MRDFLKAALLSTILLGTGVAPSHADDAAGKFAVHGIGAETCKQVVESIKKDKALGPVFTSWVLGYLSAVNLMTPETYDTSPVIDAPSIADSVYRQCEQVPDLILQTVVAGYIHVMEKASVHALSPIVEAKAGGRTVAVRAATLLSVQAALAARGHYDAKPDGAYGPKLEAALRAYQRSEKLPETGLPDAPTIVRLLVAQPPAPAPKK